MRTYSLMLFIICLNLSAFVLHQSQALTTSQELYISPFDVTNKFSLTLFGALGVGGAILGLASLLTRQYVYAAGALLIWVIGIFLPIGQWLLVGTPLILAALLPPEISYISHVVTAFFAFALFMFLGEIVSQRQLT